MPKFFVKQEQIQENTIIIKGQDINHIKKVLRAQIGEELQIGNSESGENFIATIEKIENEKIVCEIKQKIEETVESNIEVTVFQGLPKADKMELVIQKSVELGAYAITPVEMKRCVVKLTDKDKAKKIERWQKIAEVAAKQSGRNKIPLINQVQNIKNMCHLCQSYDIVIVAYENEKENKLKQELEKLKNKQEEYLKIAILIGPEGGIEEKEIDELKKCGAKVVTLGKRILRTETVALSMLSIIMYELEK